MLLYNTLTAATGEFVIPEDRPVKLYVCGVTPYDTTHIGHARTYIVFDVLLRYLRWRGATVEYCQNVTDVDDPLFERAARDGVAWQDLAHMQTERFIADCAALNMVPPTYFPRASEEIDAMIPLIERLVELGHAYVRSGNVYFDIHSDPQYGAMAHMDYAGLLATANSRGNNPDDPNKQDPLDFVLWRAGRPGDPTWDSPWGPGLPGWHIECSTMATRYLGPQLDIHGGGRDLIFPHHPCEIAQIEPVTGVRPFAHVWMHVGMVGLHGEKMSKSLGNLVFARDAVREYGANALRWYLLGFAYRDDLDYESSGVEQSVIHTNRLQEALGVIGGHGTELDAGSAQRAFEAALDTDLHTGLALEALGTLVQSILAAAAEGRSVRTAQATLAELADVLGLWVGE